MTPFGPTQTIYADRDTFYVENPHLAAGWPQHGPGDLDGRMTHPGNAPLGSDCQFITGWILILAHDKASGHGVTLDRIVGDLVAYEKATGQVHLLQRNATWAEACSRRVSPSR